MNATPSKMRHFTNMCFILNLSTKRGTPLDINPICCFVYDAYKGISFVWFCECIHARLFTGRTLLSRIDFAR